MSSTDLADEETKLEIKQAEQEALEHSILQKVTAPRAKITHKGLQDIEYNDEPAAPALAIDDGLTKMEDDEERRERERLARSKPVQRQRTMSMSVPESPKTATSPTATSWGAPPPVPASSQRDSSELLSIRTQATASGDSGQLELNLADLIHVEDESPSAEVGPSAVTAPPAASTSAGHRMAVDSYPSSSVSPTDPFQPTSSPTTAISPFAHTPTKQTFSLNTLWTSSKDGQHEEDDAETGGPVSTTPPPLSPPTLKNDTFDDDDAMVESPISQADDQDFDMFLQDKDTSATTATPPAPLIPPVDTLPEVWRGKVRAPYFLVVVIADHLPLRSQCLWTQQFPKRCLWSLGRSLGNPLNLSHRCGTSYFRPTTFALMGAFLWTVLSSTSCK